MDILIADDNADLCNMLKPLLEAHGYSVRLAANGSDALAAQREAPADVLLTDLFMPEAEGFETIERFRAAFPKTKIVVMSGDSKLARRDYLADARLLGVEATLRKPFEVRALIDVLECLRSA